MREHFLKANANRLSKIVGAIIFVIVVIYYAITIYSSNIMQTQMLTVVEHPYAVTVAAGDMKANLLLLRALPERLTYAQSTEVVDGAQEHYESIDKTMAELFDILSERYLVDTHTVPLMHKTYQELAELQWELLSITRQPDCSSERIRDFYEQRMIPKLDQLDMLADTVIFGARGRLTEYSDLVTTSRNVMTLMASVLSVAVCIAIGFYIYLLNLKRKAEEEMNRIRAELEIEQRANVAKSQFLFNMSHDIRTPMNAIIGLTAIAAMNLDKRERVKECLTKISTSSKQLLGLINDVLDMSRIESGKVSLSEEPLFLPDVIDDFISMVQSDAVDKSLDMEINVSKLFHERVIGDAVRIKRILSNLVGNSLKFTPAGGQVWLTIQELPPTARGYGSYQFIVRDNGIGMPESFMKKLFLPFERAETSTKSKVEGTGLGMAITKSIVDMMGGKIRAESELGKGSVFTVSIPLKLQSGEAETFDFSELRDLRSLVVDDDIVACENTTMILQEIGMRSEWVLTGAEAVEKTKKAHEINRDYHVAIIDWKMPDMDGMTTTRKIRQIVGAELPIIVLTAYDWVDIEEEARAAGVSAFLPKPLFKSRLYQVMHELAVGKESSPQPAAPREKQHYEGRVLVVDDNEINIEITEEFLAQFGVVPEKALNGQEAVNRIKAAGTAQYDLVFMDIQMPVMDGYEATAQIRLFEKTLGGAHVPIVAMSANAFVEEIERAYACGLDDYITKPVEIHNIEDALKRYLK